MQHNNEKLSPATIKLIIISTIVIVIIAIVSIIASNSITRQSQNNSNDRHHDNYDSLVDELPESTAPVLLQNLSFLTDIVGSNGATTALNIISDTILEYNGDPADGESYIGTALSNSLIKEVSFPYSTCNFILSVSNQKSYNVQIATESQWYYGLIIRPMPLNNANTAKLYIVFNEQASEATYTRDNAISSLTKWAKNIHSGPLTITTKDNY